MAVAGEELVVVNVVVLLLGLVPVLVLMGLMPVLMLLMLLVLQLSIRPLFFRSIFGCTPAFRHRLACQRRFERPFVVCRTFDLKSARFPLLVLPHSSR